MPVASAQPIGIDLGKTSLLNLFRTRSNKDKLINYEDQTVYFGGGHPFRSRRRATSRRPKLDADARSRSKWTSVASSADGTKLAATTDYGPIYVSTNSGLNWTPTTSPTSHHWDSVASSADGIKLVAVAQNNNTPESEVGVIYTSADSGGTWTQANVANAYWRSVASSADGTRLVAGVWGWDSIYVSTNSGVTWSPTIAPDVQGWTAVASSADGTKLVGANPFGPIYLSGDSGCSWSPSATPGYPWIAVASSADGNRLIAAANSHPLYISANSGATWTPTSTPSPSSGWLSVASSADGTKLAGGVFGGSIFISTNSGATWMDTGAPNLYWYGLAFSADGSKLTAVAYWDGIYAFGTSYAPAILTGPDSQTNDFGTTASFSVTTFGSAPLKYQWRRNGVNLTDGGNVSGATNDTLTLANVSHDDAAFYDLVLTNGVGSVTSSVVALTVVEPLILSQPASQTNFATSDVTFNVAAVGTPPLAYQWRKNGTNLVDGDHISGSTVGTLALSSILKADEGDYDVVITSAGGSITSSVAILAVLEPGIVIQPDSQTVVIGGTASFTATGFGSPPLRYQWRKNGANLADGGRISGATTTNIILTGVAPGDGGNYSLVISNDFGSAISLDAFLRVQTWLPTGAPDEYWGAVASSASGVKMVAVVRYRFGDYENYVGAPIYTSTNWGVTWEQTSAPSNFWSAVASSADGTILAATASGDGIYISTNSGATWAETTAPTGNWSAIASSADGVNLIAALAGDEIYHSADSGQTWTPVGLPAEKNWSAVASSADGMKLVAAIYGERIYVSTNAGTNWAKTPAPWAAWSAVASSADGAKLVAGINGDGIYTSTNSGDAWTLTTAPAAGWSGIASSADGTKLAATALGDFIYPSTDSGATWSNDGAPFGYWYSIASSADGNRLVATTDGAIYAWPSQPTLNITLSGSNAVISWPSFATDFLLLQNDDLTTTNWINATETVNDDGAYRSVNVNPSVSNRFYQLVRP